MEDRLKLKIKREKERLLAKLIKRQAIKGEIRSEQDKERGQ